MTLEDFRIHSPSRNRLRNSDSHSLVSGGTPREWKRAHESAQQDEGRDGSWVHAYLHRKEGDQSNAGYWYSRAGKPVCREQHDAEWLSIVQALLG
jgi:hypothetical protein